MSNPIPPVQREASKARFHEACSRCGVPSPHGHCHHRRTRAVRDAHQHCTCNLVWLCPTCHEWVHKKKFEARDVGFWVSRHVSDPSEHEVVTFLGTITLACDGLFKFVKSS